MITNLLAVNIYSPTHISGWLAIIGLSLLLGMVHGITPDEHTWPITFSYAIGSYSTKKGFRAGLLFSLAFTIQRAIASELAYLGLSSIYSYVNVNSYIYVVVGLLMLVAGLFIVQRKTVIHLDIPFLHRHKQEETTKDFEAILKDPRPWMPAVHGFIAGWGFGAFALILYTVLAPATGSAAFAWVPGALFGIGTMVVQIIAGALFGHIARRRGLDDQAVRRVALKTAGNTLTWGGVAFVLGGLLGILAPKLANASIATGIKIQNLDSLGLSFILVIFSVVFVGMTTLIVQTRRELQNLRHT